MSAGLPAAPMSPPFAAPLDLYPPCQSGTSSPKTRTARGLTSASVYHTGVTAPRCWASEPGVWKCVSDSIKEEDRPHGDGGPREPIAAIMNPNRRVGQGFPARRSDQPQTPSRIPYIGSTVAPDHLGKDSLSRCLQELPRRIPGVDEAGVACLTLGADFSVPLVAPLRTRGYCDAGHGALPWRKPGSTFQRHEPTVNGSRRSPPN
jgi:hypothetical protein